jgi:hypothetical protein
VDDRSEAESDRTVISVSGGPSRNRSARESVAPQRDQTGGCLTCIRTPCPAATKNASINHRLNCLLVAGIQWKQQKTTSAANMVNPRAISVSPALIRSTGRNCGQSNLISETSTSSPPVLGLNSLPWLVLRASSDNGKWNERPSRVCCHTCARNEFHSSLFTLHPHQAPQSARCSRSSRSWALSDWRGNVFSAWKNRRTAGWHRSQGRSKALSIALLS